MPMKNPETRQAILTLHRQGVKIRSISQTLQVSRNTVRRIVREEATEALLKPSRYEEVKPLIQDLFKPCLGNVVRVQEVLKDTYNRRVPYSALTRLTRELELREDKKKDRSGTYHFDPGEEMQHDTSPHSVIMGGQKLKAQCAGLVLACSRKLFIQHYPAFTRFEAKVFLTEAFKFMDGVCPRCIIDNTSVIVAHGSGPDADIAPEMERFGDIFGVTFVPHAVGDPDRKARIEKNFYYVQTNFLAARTFTDWRDINDQAKDWCIETANNKPKRSLGMNPDAAYLIEKPHMNPLPIYVPPVYETSYRIVDVAGYVNMDANRYSVPERLIGKQVEIHKTWDRVQVFFKQKRVADHPRLIGKRETRITAKGHHPPFNRHKAHAGACEEEKSLRGKCDSLDQYVDELKKRSSGRGVIKMRRLLDLRRTYPPQAVNKAVEQALQYGLYDLTRLEQMILSYVAGDFFTSEDQEN